MQKKKKKLNLPILTVSVTQSWRLSSKTLPSAHSAHSLSSAFFFFKAQVQKKNKKTEPLLSHKCRLAVFIFSLLRRFCFSANRLQAEPGEHDGLGEPGPDVPSHRGGLPLRLRQEDFARRFDVSQHHRCKVTAKVLTDLQ